MKRYRLSVLCATVFLSVAAIITMLAYRERVAASVPPPQTDAGDTTVSAADTTVTRTTALCVLGQWNGKLALFRGGNPYPDEVYDVFVRSFPPEDQARLAEGIAVENEAELEQLLEDYSG